MDVSMLTNTGVPYHHCVGMIDTTLVAYSVDHVAGVSKHASSSLYSSPASTLKKQQAAVSPGGGMTRSVSSYDDRGFDEDTQASTYEQQYKSSPRITHTKSLEYTKAESSPTTTKTAQFTPKPNSSYHDELTSPRRGMVTTSTQTPKSALAKIAAKKSTKGKSSGLSSAMSKLSTAGDSDEDEGKWKTALDPTSGTKYYWNDITGETSWSNPNKKKKKLKKSSKSLAADEDGNASGAGEEGKSNQKTGKKEKKQKKEKDGKKLKSSLRNQANEEEEGGVKTLQSQWEPIFHAETNDTYYWDHANKRAQWQKPADYDKYRYKSNAKNENPFASGELGDDGDLPALPRTSPADQWQEVKEKGTGKTYFWNTVDDSTSWGRPLHLKNDPVAPPLDQKQRRRSLVQGGLTRDSSAKKMKKSAKEKKRGKHEKKGGEKTREEEYEGPPPFHAGQVFRKLVRMVIMAIRFNVHAGMKLDKGGEHDKTKGWGKVRDPATKEDFFWNYVFHLSTWERPDGYSTDEDSNCKDGKSTIKVIHRWVEKYQAETGTTFYINSKTGKKSWELPAKYRKAPIAPPVAVQDAQFGMVIPSAPEVPKAEKKKKDKDRSSNTPAIPSAPGIPTAPGIPSAPMAPVAPSVPTSNGPPGLKRASTTGGMRMVRRDSISAEDFKRGMANLKSREQATPKEPKPLPQGAGIAGLGQAFAMIMRTRLAALDPVDEKSDGGSDHWDD